MKKLIRIIILVSLLVITITIASASEPKAAIVLHDDWCLVPDASGFSDWYYFEECATIVITSSKPETIVISGRAQLPEEADIPERTMNFNYKNTGYECWWDDDTKTTKYQFTLTPTGMVNFYCVFVK